MMVVLDKETARASRKFAWECYRQGGEALDIWKSWMDNIRYLQSYACKREYAIDPTRVVVTASRDDVEKLMAQVRAEPRAEIRIDLERQEAAFGGQTIPVKQPDQMRKALTQGTWDSTAELLSAADAIRATAGRLPYPNAFKS
jgi:hypothetical protein